jgi:hypothetical protein
MRQYVYTVLCICTAVAITAPVRGQDRTVRERPQVEWETYTARGNWIWNQLPEQLRTTQANIIREGVPAETMRFDPARNIQLNPDDFIVVRADDLPVTVDESIRRSLPAEVDGRRDMYFLRDVIIAPREDGTGIVTVRPVVIPERSLSFIPGERIFEGIFHVALIDINNPGQSTRLSTRYPLQFLSAAELVSPDTLFLSHTALPLTAVRVRDRNPADSVSVKVVTNTDIEGVQTWMPVRPAIVFENIPKRMQGWGIETADITVRVIGRTFRDALEVGLTADKGTLAERSASLGGTGIGSVSLRSAGLGTSHLRAVAPGVSDAEAAIEFVFPAVFFIAALSGGIFGGLLSRRKPKTGKPQSPFFVMLAESVGFGLLAAIAYYAIGLNLLYIDVDVAYFTEGAVFALAALGSLFGIRGIDSFKRSKDAG